VLTNLFIELEPLLVSESHKAGDLGGSGVRSEKGELVGKMQDLVNGHSEFISQYLLAHLNFQTFLTVMYHHLLHHHAPLYSKITSLFSHSPPPPSTHSLTPHSEIAHLIAQLIIPLRTITNLSSVAPHHSSLSTHSIRFTHN
jgi:hypothetical protein